MTEDVEVGKTYVGKVTRLMNFGAFVEVLPGKEGLVHISQLAMERVEKVEEWSTSAMKSWSSASKSTARAVSTCPVKPFSAAVMKLRPTEVAVPAAVTAAIATARNGRLS